jgi:hypothetical protein
MLVIIGADSFFVSRCKFVWESGGILYLRKVAILKLLQIKLGRAEFFFRHSVLFASLEDHCGIDLNPVCKKSMITLLKFLLTES